MREIVSGTGKHAEEEEERIFFRTSCSLLCFGFQALGLNIQNISEWEFLEKVV